jgi:hypothetical protein
VLKNKIRALSLAALLYALAAPALSSAKNALSEDTWQINPATTLASLFPDADRISLAVAVVPDPLVPRYRRLYDLDLVAIELGMLRNGYVLDRFYLPWNEKLRAANDSHQPSGNDSPSSGDDRTLAELIGTRRWRAALTYVAQRVSDGDTGMTEPGLSQPSPAPWTCGSQRLHRPRHRALLCQLRRHGYAHPRIAHR